MPSKDELRKLVRDKLGETIRNVNAALGGKKLVKLEPVLGRIGRGGQLPHWYEKLKSQGTLPNLDGKTIGSVVEMLLVAVLEPTTLKYLALPPLRINPARGVDLPDLDLGVKSPSENFCTSEPFFSAYERLIGSDHDILVLLTDYQQAKKNPPLKLQIIQWRFLSGSQVADNNLCRIALKHRQWLIAENPAMAKRVFRFLAYVNQSDWRAKRLLRVVEHLQQPNRVTEIIEKARKEFTKTNQARLKKDKLPIPDADLEALQRVLEARPLHLGIIDALDNWVIEVQKDNARAPNENEWQRLQTSPLDGLIGMSLALQWRYNFGPLFGVEDNSDDSEE